MIGLGLAALALLAQAAPSPPEEGPRWNGEWAVRADAVDDIPDPTQPPFQRARVRLAVGYARGWFGARLLAAAGTDDNGDALRRFDNARADEVVLDRIFARFAGSRLELTAGKFEMPLTTTGLLWDRKLEAQGAAGSGTLGGERVEVRARGLVSLHTRLHPDRSRLAAAQVEVLPANPALPRAALGLFVFDHLDRTPRRTNRPAPRFRVVSALARHAVARATLAFDATLHLVHNLEAARAAEGGELGLRLRDTGRGWAVRYVGQRVQRDAVPAAFSDDVWWFHTAHRGHLAAVSLTRRGLTWELGGLVQRRDDLEERLSRAFLEVRGTW